MSALESADYQNDKGKLYLDGLQGAEEVMGTSEDEDVKNSSSSLTTELFQLKIDIVGDLAALAWLSI